MTTAKALHRSVLAVALAAIGGSAAAQPTTTTTTTTDDQNTPDTTTTTTTTSEANGTTDASGTVSGTAGVNGTGVTGTAGVDVNINTPPNPPPQPAPTMTIVNPPPPPPTTTYVAPTYVESDSRGLYEKYGIGVALGGGVEGFTGDSMRSSTDPGGAWNVRLSMGLKSPLALEAAYVGSAQQIDAFGLSGNAFLVGNGAQADARLNVTGDTAVQPFIYGGVAWKRYSIRNETANTSDLIDNDDVLEVPLGVGISSKYAGLLLDLRGEYRVATQGDLVSQTNPDARMDRFGVNANIGVAF